MSFVHHLNHKSLAWILLALSLAGPLSLSIPSRDSPTAVIKSLPVPPASATSAIPVLVGWGGIALGESLTDIQTEMQTLSQLGYNIVRVDFEPTCTSPPDGGILGSYDATKMAQVIALAKQYNLWIIVDYHGYTDLESGSAEQCWLGFWQSLVANFTAAYSEIIWEPLNEPAMTNTSDVAGLSTAYQALVNEVRALGDTHWIVVQNLCSSSCSFGDANMAAGYPTVNDTAGHIFISLHSYMAYQYYSSAWNNATADTLAQEFYNAVVTGMTTTGWPALNTEGGTDPIMTNCSGGVNLPSSLCAPDQILVGSAGYSIVTFHFIQTLTNLYDTNTPQRINWVWWPAGSWTDTPNAGTLGATQCLSVPIGWSCLLMFKSPGSSNPDFTINASSPSRVDVSQSASSTITITALNGFTGGVTLTDTMPAGLNCGNISPASVSGSGTATVSCSATSAGDYTLSINGASGSLTHSSNIAFSFVSAGALPTLTVPGPQNATVGESIHFTVKGNDPSGKGGTVILSATGLTSGMNFDPSTGTLTFTPSASQAGHTYLVNFTATDSNEPSWTRTESVPIHVQSINVGPSSGGGYCFSCLLPRQMTTNLWLLAIGVLVGFVSAIALLHRRAAAELTDAHWRHVKIAESQRCRKLVLFSFSLTRVLV